jgi:hypothetical protein
MSSLDRIFACLPSIEKLIVVMITHCKHTTEKGKFLLPLAILNQICEERPKTL